MLLLLGWGIVVVSFLVTAVESFGGTSFQCKGCRTMGGIRMSSVAGDFERKVLRTFSEDKFSLVVPARSRDPGSEGVQSIFSLSLADQKGVAVVNARLGHKTSGPVPRSHAPSMLVLEAANSSQPPQDEGSIMPLLEECLRWYLDAGGRIGKLIVAAPADSEPIMRVLQKMGFTEAAPGASTLQATAQFSLSHFFPAASVIMTGDGRKLIQFIDARIKETKATSSSPTVDHLFTLHDVAGRLYHDLGEPKNSIEPYTSALIANPSSASAFRNLGSAYQAVGNSQMAFASFQQAIQLDPSDALVYLKLAFFYEDFASKDWVDAAEHAMRCYAYYLEHVDGEDTAVLTRLGNLQVREHRSEEAIESYSKALRVDETMASIWFNKAQAQVKAGEMVGARESLHRTLALDPTIVTATHMLKALSPPEAHKVEKGDDSYVRELFDSYSTTYDPHVKKLMYAVPRLIRQEMAKIYRGRFTIDNSEEIVPANLPSQTPGCTTIIPTITINSTLDVLDLGCGTGLAGAWLKDYARTLAGVDLSEQMVTIARKKMLYDELSVMSISTYLHQCERKFDLVVAADVLSYVGDLRTTFQQVGSAVRSGGHFAFSAEGVEGNKDAPAGGEKIAKGFTLLMNGRQVCAWETAAMGSPL